jgi:ABC-type transport system involved in multi-copper enzyme maturation permease subunit
MNKLWLAQVRGIMRLELKKHLFSFRALPMYLLAALPVLVAVIFIISTSVFGVPPELQGPAGAAMFFAGLFQFALRGVVYFGCVWIFMNLFRGEVLDRSLHYYFLAPIRREVLVAGKYLSAWTTSVLLFGSSAAASFISIYWYLGGAGVGGLLRGESMGQLVSYLFVTVLACLGYGAVFLLVGLFFRNPIIPALAIMLWELINPFLPALLKKISVIFYLQSLLPVPLAQAAFAILADPVSAWLAVPGLILFTALTFLVAGWRIRKMEITYASD